MAIATFSCIITLWGWWDLGQKVTLNLIKTAKAFNIPKFRTADLSYRAKDIVKGIRDLEVECIQVELLDETGNSVPSMELRLLETRANEGRDNDRGGDDGGGDDEGGNNGGGNHPTPSQLWCPRLRNTPQLAVAAILLTVSYMIASTTIIIAFNN